MVPHTVAAPKEILVVYAWGHVWVKASRSLVAVRQLPFAVGTEGLVTLNGLLFFFFFFNFDQVQASLRLVIRKVRCRGYLAALRAPVMVAYLWVESSQESLSHR